MIPAFTCVRRPGLGSALGKFSRAEVTRHEGTQNADFPSHSYLQSEDMPCLTKSPHRLHYTGRTWIMLKLPGRVGCKHLGLRRISKDMLKILYSWGHCHSCSPDGEYIYE